ncbi:hypothetical protein RHSIM_Rhsim11G0077700 [Rhododendron simsii]|uniref:Uncharacterized protein n=1 Tax=Rhododendron simsii TaxID=118357 RepID=A0A834L8G3_RHOSS|nr:hypothetical protein RHSIM_Rhsim11G0077700 [Rhododendron simsii]
MSSNFWNTGADQRRKHSTILSEWGFYRKTSQRQKSIKSYVVEESGGEEGDETDMARFRVRPQENHDVEGSSKIRTRFGSVTREIKAKKPRLDVEESEQKCTRSGSVAQGIKAKDPCSRKPRDENKEEICETTYQASLDVIFIFCMYLTRVSINFWVDTFQLV